MILPMYRSETLARSFEDHILNPGPALPGEKSSFLQIGAKGGSCLVP